MGIEVLVVDDDPQLRRAIGRILKIWNYDPIGVPDGLTALKVLKQRNESGNPLRIILLDLKLPGVDGITVIKNIRSDPSITYEPYIVVLSAINDKEAILQAIKEGANDYITKPFEMDELKVRLEAAKRVLAVELREALIKSLSAITEFKSLETGFHIERVQKFSHLLAEEYMRRKPDRLTPDDVRNIYHASPLHDIGKVGIPDRILTKPGKLTPEEFEIMKQHTVIGAEIISRAKRAHPYSPLLDTIYNVVRYHHEWWDGTGYPDGLRRDEIPIEARIVAVADVYDAITSQRVYKPAYPHRRAVEEIITYSGTQFDPEVVEVFLSLEETFAKIMEEMKDRP